MPSSASSDGSELSTIQGKSVSNKEVAIIVDVIQRLPKKLKPSKTQLVIGIVHKENVKQL